MATTYHLLPNTGIPDQSEMLSRAEEAEFPGLPSTQEWRDDFPATQTPPRKPRTAYITPQTSFIAPPDDAEIDGFDIELLAQAPHTPVQQMNDSRRKPSTPMSITKRDSSRESDTSNSDVSTMEVPDWFVETPNVDSLEPQSPLPHTWDVPPFEGTKIPRRRRRRPKKHNRHRPSSSDQSDQNTTVPRPTALLPSTPEPWPVPFPLADTGIYPYLPPAKQFEQMVKFTSATEEHIDKWHLHNGAYPVPLLRQVLSAQECVHMGFWSQLEHMDKLLGELENLMKPIYVRKRVKRGKVGAKYKRLTPQMLNMIRFMRSITKQQQICYYESRIPTRSESRGHLFDKFNNLDVAV